MSFKYGSLLQIEYLYGNNEFRFDSPLKGSIVSLLHSGLRIVVRTNAKFEFLWHLYRENRLQQECQLSQLLSAETRKNDSLFRRKRVHNGVGQRFRWNQFPIRITRLHFGIDSFDCIDRGQTSFRHTSCACVFLHWGQRNTPMRKTRTPKITSSLIGALIPIIASQKVQQSQTNARIP